MEKRGFLTGFVLPMGGALAVTALTGPRRRQGRPGLRREECDPRYASSGGSANDPGRGRQAGQPHEIPARGWRDILWRVKDEMSRDNLSILAAGCAFYAMLAIVPALAAAISLFGLVADPVMIEQQIEQLAHILPQEAQGIITDQLSRLASQPRTGLSVGAMIGILFALWSASYGIQTLMTGLNVVYDEEEKRGFVQFYATALMLTLGAILSVLVALTLVAVLPAVLAFLGLPSWVETAISTARWPLLGVLTMFGLAVLYRYGPSRREARWQWVSWGAVAATILWLIVSSLFSLYVSRFGSYNETYGTLGAVVILLMWFYLTAYIILMGGELNAEMEHQTAKDTTRSGRPLGARGAHMADTVGAVP